MNSELFRKSSRAISDFAWFIEKFGFLNPKSKNLRMHKLIARVKELKEMSKALAKLA
jgi:hypothetical protein